MSDIEAPTAARMCADRSVPWRSLQVVARVLSTVLFDLKVYGTGHVPARGGALIVSNHQSNLDPVLLAVRLNRPLNYIAKSELFESPVGGWLLRSVFNAFPVRQGAGDVGAVRETIHRLHEGHLLNIYPEGARTKDGRIGPMQRGVGLIVRRARVPVVPAVIVGSFDAWSIHRKVLRPWPIRIQFGPSMVLAGLAPEQIIARLDQTLQEMFNALRDPSHSHRMLSAADEWHITSGATVSVTSKAVAGQGTAAAGECGRRNQ